jgi:hypothetical protein
MKVMKSKDVDMFGLCKKCRKKTEGWEAKTKKELRWLG